MNNTNFVEIDINSQRNALLAFADEEEEVDNTLNTDEEGSQEEDDAESSAAVKPVIGNPITAKKASVNAVTEDEEDEEEGSDDFNLADTFFSKVGITKTGKIGTLDELAIATKEVIDELQSEINEYKSTPVVNELIEWFKKGGDLESFKLKPTRYDYSDINLEDLETQKEIIRQLRISEGEDEEVVEEEISYLEQGGRLRDRATKGLARLDKANEKEVNDFNAQVEQDLQQQQESINNVWKEVETTINKGTISGFVLPKEELKSFSTYILRDTKGVSVAEQKRNTLTIEQQLLIDYIIMKDFNVKGLKNNKTVVEEGSRTLSKLALGDSKKIKSVQDDMSLEAFANLGTEYKKRI